MASRAAISALTGVCVVAVTLLASTAHAQTFDPAGRISDELAARFQISAETPADDLSLEALTVPGLPDVSIIQPREEGLPLEQADPGLQPLTPTQDRGAGSSLPWYERFTVSAPTALQSAWGESATQFNFSAGDRWGFTLGITEGERGPQFEIGDVSAGAYYDLSDRFRLGTNLRFSSPESDVFGQDSEVNAPELKFESAFRF